MSTSSPTRRTGCGLALSLSLLPAMMAFRSAVYESFYVPSGSMEPTLRIGDRVLASRSAYGWRLPFTRIPLGELASPERGDIVVFTRLPEEDAGAWWASLDIAGLLPAHDYLKRVVAVAGDTVAVRDGLIELNGRVHPSEDAGPYRFVDHTCTPMQTRRRTDQSGPHSLVVLQATEPSRRQPDWGPEVVPDGHVFVLGDNRDRSSDSRSFGVVPLADIKGRATHVWASLPLCTVGDSLPEVRWSRVGKRLP